MDKDLEGYIDLEVYTSQEKKLLEQRWKDFNEDQVKTFTILGDGKTQFNIRADVNLTVREFKRLILT